MYSRSVIPFVMLGLLAGTRATADTEEGSALDAACTRPEWSHELPSPSDATREQMLAAQAAVRSFDADVTRYGECLAAAEARLVAEGGDGGQVLAARAQRNDGAVAIAERVVADFNALLEAWRPYQPDTQPPKLLSSGSQREKRECLALGEWPGTAGSAMQATILIRIDVDGVAALERWPDGVPESYRPVVECLLGLSRFAPPVVDGQPAAARANMPVSLVAPGMGEYRVDLEPPALALSGEELAGAEKACTPPGWQRRGETVVEVLVSSRGEVVEARVSRTSGEAAIDDIARCIAGKARFKAGKRNGRPREMTTFLSVTVGRQPGDPGHAEPAPAIGSPLP